MHVTRNTIGYSKALGAAIFTLLLSLLLVSYTEQDYSIMHDTSYLVNTHNYLGSWGAQLAGLLFYLFGGAAWELVFIGVYISYSYRSFASTPVGTILVAFVISMLISAYIQVYPGACGIVLLKYLYSIFEPWQVVLFLYCIVWAFVVVCIFEPFYYFCMRIRLLIKTVIKNLVKQYMTSVSHEER